MFKSNMRKVFNTPDTLNINCFISVLHDIVENFTQQIGRHLPPLCSFAYILIASKKKEFSIKYPMLISLKNLRSNISYTAVE